MEGNIFSEIEDKSQKAPAELKNVVVSELNSLRNILEIATLFLGTPFEVLMKIMDNNNDQIKN